MQTLALNTTTANTIISEVMRELLPAGSDAMHNLGEALLDGSTLDKQQIHALLQTLANNPALIKYADKKANNIRRTKAKRTAKKAVEESNSASASWRWVSQDHYHTNGARKRNRRKPLASATATANNVPTGPNVSRRQPQPPRTAPVVASIPTSTTSSDVDTYQTVPVVSMTPVYLESQEVDHDGHRSLGSLSAVELDLQANYLTMSSPSSSYYSDSEYSLSSSENPSSPFESSSSPSPSSSTSSTSLFEAFQQGEEDAVAWALEEAANFASQIIPSAAQLPPFDATLPASTTSSSSSSSTTSDEGARSIDAFFSELAQWGDLPPLDMAN